MNPKSKPLALTVVIFNYEKPGELPTSRIGILSQLTPEYLEMLEVQDDPATITQFKRFKVSQVSNLETFSRCAPSLL